MTRSIQALMIIAMATLLASATASAAPILLGPGTYSIGPLSTDHDGTIHDTTKFTTSQAMNLSLHLHADLNPPPQGNRPLAKVLILQVDPNGGSKTEIFRQELTATGDIDIDLPTILAALEPSGPSAYYLVKVVAKLAHEGGGFDGSFTLSPVPVPAAVWLFGTALVGLSAFARRRRMAAAA